MRTLAAALVVGLAGSAVAQSTPDSSTFEERNVYLFTPDGKMIRMKAGDEAHAMMMKNMKPMAANCPFASTSAIDCLFGFCLV